MNAFPGAYNFSIEKDEYIDYFHSFSLSDEPLDINVVMEPLEDSDPPTGIDELMGDDIKVFPNPVNDIMNVEFYNPSESIVSLTNMHGQIIKTTAIHELGHHQLQFNLGSFPPGVYILGINWADISLIKKIILN